MSEAPISIEKQGFFSRLLNDLRRKGTVPKKEVVQTPRQRVEESLRQRQKTFSEWVSVLNNFTCSPEKKSAEKERLEKKMEDQMKEFKEKIINTLPEAQTWQAITEENLNTAVGGVNYRVGSVMDIIALNNMHADAVMNVINIRKRNASAPVNSDKTS